MVEVVDSDVNGVGWGEFLWVKILVDMTNPLHMEGCLKFKGKQGPTSYYQSAKEGTHTRFTDGDNPNDKISGASEKEFPKPKQPKFQKSTSESQGTNHGGIGVAYHKKGQNPKKSCEGNIWQAFNG
ncbi:hypothetical protein FH972_015115 [Carpinus fangiana]|uniref:Uncharacterized protein n=1 Tax=Carpinus fangiana TaxID=176857 RepID=A0A5N6REI0_9ROSI|nr:hypothetical protein FH972_015115 [Carpinus fangiana]